MNFSAIVQESRLLSTGRLIAMVWSGKSPICGLQQVLRSHEKAHRIARLVESIIAKASVIERDDVGELWRTPFGDYWFPPDMGISRLATCIAEQQAGIYASNERQIDAGAVILDCGANIGAFSRRCIERGARFVIAVEPAPVNLACLTRNLQRSIEDGSSVVVPAGVWSGERALTMSLDPRNPLRHSVVFDRGAENEVCVNVRTIDRISKELHLRRLDLIKMDVEGAEWHALEGARATIRALRPTLAIAVEHGKDLIANARSILALVKDIRDDYTWDCTFCEELKGGLIFPEVLVFH